MNIMKKYIVFFVIILSIAVVGLIVLKTYIGSKTDIRSKKDTIEALVFKTKTGFGYSISYNNKVLIKQDYIPAIQYNQAFCNFEDAQKVADLVKEKLNRNENPKISLIELKNLEVQLTCPD
tara:strand:- start:1483 stop:1845 length:363 start_codon:yes stop_codon:yes gene_type:complete